MLRTMFVFIFLFHFIFLDVILSYSSPFLCELYYEKFIAYQIVREQELHEQAQIFG